MAKSGSEVVRDSWLQWALKAYEDLRDDYERFEDYYIGDHELEFATERWKSIFGTVFEQFADNWCGVVVDSLAQRLEIIGWETDGDKADVKIAEDIWDREWLGTEEEDLTTQTLVKGDGYLIGWPNPESKDESQLFFNDAAEVNIYYDPANRRRATRACKKYQDTDGVWHIFVYYPDHTDHFISTDLKTDPFYIVQFTDSFSPQTMPAGWKLKETIKNPFETLPVFHFKNKMVNSTHGISEIKQVIPIQNAVNKMLMDMMISSEFGGFPQKWMAGGGHPKGGWPAGAERIWATTDSAAKFGSFPSAELEPYVRVLEMLIAQIAKITQTPMHYLRTSGDMPSGEALKAAESGLVKKAVNRQKQFGTVWAQAMSFAVAMEKGKGTSLKKLSTPVTPVWRSAETRHDLEQAQVAQLKSILGIPLEHLWSEHFGYSEEEIKQFKKENRAIAASVLASVVGQIGQLPPGAESLSGIKPDQLIQLIQESKGIGPGGTDESGPVDITQILALLPKSVNAQTSAGEATAKPQPNSKPPASPTRRSVGFKD